MGSLDQEKEVEPLSDLPTGDKKLVFSEKAIFLREDPDANANARTYSMLLCLGREAADESLVAWVINSRAQLRQVLALVKGKLAEGQTEDLLSQLQESQNENDPLSPKHIDSLPEDSSRPLKTHNGSQAQFLFQNAKHARQENLRPPVTTNVDRFSYTGNPVFDGYDYYDE